ncbi:hypothetical protein TSAR_004084 [Trichomalopsis sarcophagae]|uniref:Uncharacterized protein n=1 Tax=Trichomalopsis sarcophagae TaxID=543379 RepID=A0A232F243_9HYME|nr:hypothetical protein TSAR_004084 [Trichomalopsis sarcophagae]
MFEPRVHLGQENIDRYQNETSKESRFKINSHYHSVLFCNFEINSHYLSFKKLYYVI